MENNSLQIINLYKHNVVYVSVNKKRKIQAYAMVLAFVFLNIAAFSLTLFNSDYSKTLQTTINYIYNPVNTLYNDLGHIIFTSGGAYKEFNTEKEVTVNVPVLTNKLEIKTDYIAFEITDNVMVMSCCDGVIEEVGNLEDNTKYIEIKHSKSISTRYENIDIAGVVPGDVVKPCQDIATAKTGEIVRFYILKDGEPVTSLSINKNKVEWQN